ncbi:MAG: hypothetical protein H0U13_04400 [Gemmatimonadaceae bacterium]|nr:hypothetical protein [Gemmatimonadaceae bacterium]
MTDVEVVPDSGPLEFYGWLSVMLGVAGATAASALLVDVSEIAAVVTFALIVFQVEAPDSDNTQPSMHCMAERTRFGLK